MWIFTKDGFYSIVQHKDQPDTLIVRSRVREDLERAFGPEDISENVGSDYRFRKTMNRLDVASYLVNTTLDLDYTSVKDEISQGDPERKSMLYQVWDAGWRFQEKVNEPTFTDDEYEFFWKGLMPT